MVISEIKKGVYGMIIHDWDRKLFDELIPLPDGTTYNSYFIRDEKNVLIDTADPSKTMDLVRGLEKIGVDRIDYIVSNHSEQDHSGSIPEMLKRFPGSRVLAGEKASGLLQSMLLIPPEKIEKVRNGQSLSIGRRSLVFMDAPWAHWPETILTYCPEEKILFPCDLFGSHLAESDFYGRSDGKLYASAKRYYAEIMMPFRSNIARHLEAVEALSPEVIAPSHGPVHRNPSFILDAYRDWVSDKVRNQVVIPYVSMHGSVAAMVDFFTNRLIDQGVGAKPFNLVSSDVGELASSLVDAATVVIGSPMVLTGPHPAALYATYLFRILRPKTRFASVIGSFGWGGNMLKMITEMLPGNIEVIEPVIAKGYPLEKDFESLAGLAGKIFEKHEKLGLT